MPIKADKGGNRQGNQCLETQESAKKKDYIWKRIKLGLWKKTDEDEKEFARQDLAELTKKADKKEIDLVYFDGSGFNLWAKVVYAWQKRGERITVPVTRGTSPNVLGLMLRSVSKV